MSSRGRKIRRDFKVGDRVAFNRDGARRFGVITEFVEPNSAMIEVVSLSKSTTYQVSRTRIKFASRCAEGT